MSLFRYPDADPPIPESVQSRSDKMSPSQLSGLSRKRQANTRKLDPKPSTYRPQIPGDSRPCRKQFTHNSFAGADALDDKSCTLGSQSSTMFLRGLPSGQRVISCCEHRVLVWGCYPEQASLVSIGARLHLLYMHD